MNRKLTLSLEGELIDRAKGHARAKGISLSEMVENYFKLKNKPKEKNFHLKLKGYTGRQNFPALKQTMKCFLRH